MKEGSLEYRLEQLSKTDRQLILLKLKELMANTSAIHTSEKPKRLVAYVQAEASYKPQEVETFLKQRLPVYMIPSTIYEVPSMPLLPNGKVDRKNLKPVVKDIELNNSSVTDISESGSKTELQLIKIWEDVLNFSPVHPDDNFFEIGGDSILSIQIIAKARKLGIELSANLLFEHQTISALAKHVTPKKEDNSTEEKLIAIWEEVLNIKPIHTDDNFFEIGGDSILSIQIIAKARKLGLKLSANQLFKYQTIGELSPLLSSTDSTAITSNEIVVGEVAMTPIQHWFFDTHKNAPQFWNQGFKIVGIPEISEEQFKNIGLELIAQHDTLRSSFKKNEENWSRYLLDSKESQPTVVIDISNIDDIDLCIEENVASIQNQFNVSEGDLFKCLYFKGRKPQDSIVVLIAHHLLVDAVSWQIIINDFRTLINLNDKNSKLVENKTTTLNEWGDYLNVLANSDELQEEIDFWRNQTNESPNLPTDKPLSEPILERSIVVSEFKLNKEKTVSLLTEANKKYNTKIEELLITALTLTLSQWSKEDFVNLGMERHGRETMNTTQIDLSNSVGWFTSYFPVKLQFETKDLGIGIKSVKEQLRSIPNKGLGYGVLKYKNSTLEVDSISDYSPEVLFNYLGVNNQVKETEELFVVETLNTMPLRSNDSERTYLFEINTFIQNDVLSVNWSYSENIHNPSTINTLTVDFKRNLETIIDHCLGDHDETYAPSDFPEALLNEDDLNNLLNSL